MKIGRLVRALKLETIAPVRITSDAHRRLITETFGLKIAKANYMCASACFFVFVAGIKRTSGFLGKPFSGCTDRF